MKQIDTTYINYFLLIITDSYRFDERKSEETPEMLRLTWEHIETDKKDYSLNISIG